MIGHVVIPAVKTLGDGLFRVEWLGQVLRGTTTCVSVIFSPMQVDADTGELRASPDNHKAVAVPVAYLRMFRIGDLWKDGIAVGQRDLLARETFSLSIQDGSAHVMPAGVPVDGTAGHPVYPLPFSVFSGHRENTQSHCVRVALGGNAWLVIPCMELIRFYFGGSGSFLKRLFSGAFALDKLYKRCQFNSRTRAARIELADDLSGAAAATVARIALSSQAKRAARWIVNSAIAAAANKVRYHPKTTFPFFGKTDLMVDGRWIDQTGVRVFVAEQIVRCTHPFPFESLYYTTSKSIVELTRAARMGYALSTALPPTDATGLAEIPLSADAASPTLQPVGVLLNESVFPFPDLQRKKIRRIREATPPSSQPRAAPITSLSAGDPLPGADGRTLEVDGFIEESQEELPPEQLGLLEAAFFAYEGASRHMPPSRNGRVVWMAPDGSPGEGSNRRFVRATHLCNLDERTLANVWCSTLGFQKLKPRLLVMMRGNVLEDVPDHVLFLRLEAWSNRHIVESALLAFARADHESLLRLDVVEAVQTRSVENVASILRVTSRAMESILSTAKHRGLQSLTSTRHVAANWPIDRCRRLNMAGKLEADDSGVFFA